MVAKGSSSTAKKLLCFDTIAAIALCSSTLTSLLNSEYGLRQTLVIIRLPKAHQRLFVRSYARAFQGVSEIARFHKGVLIGRRIEGRRVLLGLKDCCSTSAVERRRRLFLRSERESLLDSS